MHSTSHNQSWMPKFKLKHNALLFMDQPEHPKTETATAVWYFYISHIERLSGANDVLRTAFHMKFYDSGKKVAW